MLRTAVVVMMTLAIGTSMAAPTKMRTLTIELVAWSEDGTSALARLDEEDSDGSRALGYRVVIPGESLETEFALAGGALRQRPRVTLKDCVAQATALRDLLAQRHFREVVVDPARCSSPEKVVSVSVRAKSEVERSFLAPRPSAGNWFELRDGELRVGHGENVEVKLFAWPDRPKSHRVALSPSSRLLVSLRCSQDAVCAVDSYVSASGKIADLAANDELAGKAPPPSGGEAAPRDLAGDRAWWDGAAAKPRSPVQVSFDPEGQHPFSCVREDGAYWMYEQDDTGIRVARDGKISSRDGSLGTIDEKGMLQLRGSPAVRVDGAGRIYCRTQTKAFARVDRNGVITRDSGGERLGAIHGEVDWQKNRRAAFLLLVDACKLDQP